MQWLKHAFAVDAPEGEPPVAQREVVDALCLAIVQRHLTVPALAFLELARPLNYFGAQTLYFLAPFLSALTASPAHQHLAAFLERRDSVESICKRIEVLEEQAQGQERT